MTQHRNTRIRIGLKTLNIQDLIQKHKKVFQDLPMELLPQIRIEHIIEVKPGSSSVKVRPYKYPHHHKT